MSTSYTNNYPATGYASETQLRTEFGRLRTALLDTISRTNSGTGSNAMAADLDLDGNDILNVNIIDTKKVNIDGKDYISIIESARAQAEEASDAAQLASVFLKEFLGDYAQEILNFPLDLGFITDAPVTASYDLGELL